MNNKLFHSFSTFFYSQMAVVLSKSSLKQMKNIRISASKAANTVFPIALAVFSCLLLSVLVNPAYADLKVYPRIITPGTPPENEKVFFEFSFFDEPKPTLRIIDITGRKIREISVLNPRPIAAGWIVTWDGTDENGSVVLPGVYIYQWEEGIKTINGTIVVSR